MVESQAMDWLAGDASDDVSSAGGLPEPWRVLIVDDEPEVHEVTKLALRHFRFADRPLRFLHAYSGAESIQTVREDSDIAVVLMDVVMESEHAGLEAVDAIRNQLGNRFCRIILRTGHPGQAPENEIIARYDIDDYKEKTELTAKRLFTTMYVALRSYRDLRALNQHRLGLERVISAASNLLARRGIEEFGEGVLEQISALLHTPSNGFMVRAHGFVSTDMPHEHVVASTGRYADARNLDDVADVDSRAAELVNRNLNQAGTLFQEERFVHCIESPSGRHMLLYLEGEGSWSDLDQHMLELFSHNVAMSLDNLFLNEQVVSTQRELVLMLGEAIEMRSLEAGNHVHRVAEYSALLAQLYGLDEEQVHNLKFASPLHDVGKIAIEDAILNKPGRHTEDETRRMQEHASIGAEIFKGRDLPVLKTAGIVAAEHHENWDGSGYPEGKSGEDIHIYGRIVALADVYDALLSARCYKPAWSEEKTLAFVQEQSGKKFDPKLVQLLLDNLDEFRAIGQRLADQDEA